MKTKPAGIVLVVALLALTAWAPAGAKELVLWPHWEPDSVGEPLDNVIIPAFKAEAGLDVIVSYSPDNDIERLTLAVAADTTPDVMIIKNEMLPNLATEGLLEPLDRLIASSPVVRREDYSPGAWAMGQWKGVTYAIPAIEFGPVGTLAFRRDLFAAAGLPDHAPETVADLRSFHQSLTTIDGNGVNRKLGFHPWISFGRTMYGWASLYDIDWYDDEAGTISLNNDETLAMVEDMFWFFDNVGGFQVADQFHQRVGNWVPAFATGDLGMMITGYYNVRGSIAQGGLDPSVFGHSWTPSPHGDTWVLDRGGMAVIPKGTDEVEAAFRFIEMLALGDGPKALFEHAGFLNGNIQLIQQLDIPPDSDLHWFASSAFVADRAGEMPKHLQFNAIVGEWADGLRTAAMGDATVIEVLEGIERRYNTQ